MGGNNTKQAPETEWNNHRTSEQSSTLPYDAQIHTKYENNIQELIDNLHTNTTDNNYNFNNIAKIINNTLSYNTKYQNKIDENNVLQHPPVSVPEPDTRDSPFLSPVKYANLLNSTTSADIKQYGGGPKKNEGNKKKDEKNKKKDKTHKMSKKYNKSSESPTLPKSNTSSTDPPVSDEDTQSEAVGDSNESTPKNDAVDTSDDDTNTPDEDTNTSEEDTNTADDEKQSEGNDKYESPSSASNSVHTSQINMLDSY
jgi:hypothetical protein